MDPRFDDVRSLNDLSEHTLLEIQHFFEIYQVLEQREVNIGGWEDRRPHPRPHHGGGGAAG